MIPRVQTQKLERSCQTPSEPSTPILNLSPQTCFFRQRQVVPSFQLGYEAFYTGNLIEQLDEVEFCGGVNQIIVILPNSIANKEETEHAIVQQFADGRKVLPDKFIAEEKYLFKLCSADGTLHAVMKKNMNMRYCLEWTVNGGSKMIWLRTRDTTNMNNATQGSPISAASFATARSFQEIFERTANDLNMSASSNSALTSTQEEDNHKNSICQEQKTEEELFKFIKKQCSASSSLMRKVLSWGNNEMLSPEQTKEDLWNLSVGRVWVTASLYPDNEAVETEIDALDDIKGAYQIINTDSEIYYQSESQKGDPEKLYRVRKTPQGLWRFDVCNLKSKSG